MFRIVSIMLLILVTSIASASEMNPEGSCKGAGADGTLISFNFFSAFDGCQNKSEAAIAFTDDTMQGTLLTGTRLIQKNENKYSFTIKSERSIKTVLWLTFAGPNGDSQGVFKYRDSIGNLSSVTLQCRVRQYDYAECPR